MLHLAKQFARFLGVGCLSACGHFGTLILLVWGASAEAVVASTAGALVGAAINYALNYRFTFRSTTSHRESLIKFAFVAVVGLVLNALLMWIGVHLLALHYVLAQVLTTGLVMIWSFLAHRFWTFVARPLSAHDEVASKPR